MTKTQAADHDSWLVKCSPRALGFIQSNQHNYIQGLEEYWERGLKIFLKRGNQRRGDKYPLQAMELIHFKNMLKRSKNAKKNHIFINFLAIF